jgi:hypothetical protein
LKWYQPAENDEALYSLLDLLIIVTNLIHFFHIGYNFNFAV